MTEKALDEFVRNYGDADLDRIKFAWNGKHADELRDPNAAFRIEVCEYLIRDFSVASDQLVRNLYLELSKSSKETWSVYRSYHMFAQELLNRGVTKYLLDYSEGAMRSFDTVLGSGRISLTDEQRGEISDFVQRELLGTPDARTRSLLEFAKGRFLTKNTDV